MNGARAVVVTRGHSGEDVGCSKALCRHVDVTTIGFSAPVTCRVSNSSIGLDSGFHEWPQGANETLSTANVFAHPPGAWIEVTCMNDRGESATGRGVW